MVIYPNLTIYYCPVPTLKDQLHISPAYVSEAAQGGYS